MSRKKFNCQILVHLHLTDWKMQFNITNEFLKEEIYPHFQTKSKLQYLTVQFSSVIQSCPSLCDPMDCSMPGFPVHHQPRSLLKIRSIESVVPSKHLILCRPILLPPSIFPSIRVFSNESVLHNRWPNLVATNLKNNPKMSSHTKKERKLKGQ